MSEPLRWGILGASKFARQHMAPAIHEADGAVLAALATSDPAKAAPFQAFQPELRVLDDYDALLADPQIDAVYIPLPNHLHVTWTEKALAAGKHVLCEKPIAMAAGEFDRLIAARDASGRLAAEAYMIVHHPQWQRVRRLVDEGLIGRLRHVDSVFTYDNRADTGNIRNRAETGGGGIPDIGVYTFGATRFVTGREPRSVTAKIDYENGVDTFALVTADFEVFSFSSVVSMRLYPRQEVTFHGEAGTIRVPAPFNAGLYGEARLEIRAGGSEWVERFTDAKHYKLQVENFGATVRDGVDYPCPLEFSRGTQAMIDQVFQACPPPKGE
jgi:predicted dehydrogenase